MLAPLSWALAGLVTVFFLTRERREVQAGTDLRRAA